MDRPQLKIQVGLHSIRWTYGLQQDLQRIVPDLGNVVALVAQDPYVQDYFLRRALTDHKGLITDDDQLLSPEDVDLDPDQIVEVLDWLTGHLMYFFVSTVGKMAHRGKNLQTSLPQLEQSTSGSAPSV